MKCTIAVTALLFGMLLSEVAQSQSVGTISGTVADTTEGVIPNASVTIKNQGTGLDRTVAVGAEGRYTATGLPIGTYSITASAQGFQAAEHRDISLEVGQIR